MAQKGRFYSVTAVPKGLKRSYPLSEVRHGMIVRALENSPKGSLDVVDVRLLKSGKLKSVYSFQLDDPVKKPVKE